MEGDGHTLGLLIDLRELCRKLADRHELDSIELHRLLQQLQNPNLHGLDRELSFRVIQKAPEYYGEPLRIVSANANLKLGHAAFEAAIRQDPKSGRVLKYPGGLAGRYDPPGTVIGDK